MSRPVISAWSAVSPFGIGGRPFAEGVVSGRDAVVALDPERWPVPASAAALVPGFDIREVLGRKGTRSMDRVSALAVATVGDLLDTAAHVRKVATGENAALVLGTTAGSAKSMMDITRDTLLQKKPFYIDTGRIPNAIMNSAAAQCAIWHGLQGPNATVAGGRVAGLFALRYALRLLSAGRAAAVLCGGVEELTPERLWLEHHGRGAEPEVPLGEGCALVLIEPVGTAASSHAEILAVETAVYPEDGLAGAYAKCVRRTLARAGVGVADLWALSPAALPGWEDAERQLVEETLDGHRPRWLSGHPAWGDAGAATAAFQIASVLAVADADPADTPRTAAVVSADRDGVLGCAVLRVG